jgi:AraC-like DNA-binding protein
MPNQLLAEHKMLQDGNVTDTVNIGKELFWSNRCQTSEDHLSLDAQFNGIDLGAISIIYLTFGSNITIEPSETDQFFIVQTTLEGSSTTTNGDFSVQTTRNDIAIIDPLLPTKISFTPGCAHLVLKVERKLLESKLQSLLNQQLGEPIKFEQLSVENDVSKKSWINTMNFLCEFYEKPYSAGLTAKNIVNSHVDMVANTILNMQKHNYFDKLNDEKSVETPRHVRRACEYIEQHIREKITLNILCDKVGVSQRTLQTGFKKYLGQSPVEFIRNRRLHYIHAALNESKGKTNVSRIMWEFGVNNPGLWANIYKERYGCYPSETLNM